MSGKWTLLVLLCYEMNRRIVCLLQARIVQGREPPQFLALFKCMCILKVYQSDSPRYPLTIRHLSLDSLCLL